MNRRTLGAGSVVRRLVVLGVLTAFCLVLISSTVSASLHPWGNTPNPNIAQASLDPFGHDDAAPLRSTWLDSIVKSLVNMWHKQPPTLRNTGESKPKQSGSVPNTPIKESGL
jgi:hypothetical protein